MKNKKRIAFDFDKIFVNYPPLIPDFVVDFLYKQNSQKLKYRLPGKFEQKLRIVSHLTFFRPPIATNINSLKKLYALNKNIYLISSRFSFLKKRTDIWLAKNPLNAYFKKIFFNYNNSQPHLFKKEIIKKEKIEQFIDDDLDLLIYLSKNMPNVKFYWLTNKTKHYNLPENIKKIKNVDEFLKKYL